MPTKSEALSFLANLKVGDRVVITQDSRESWVTVQQPLHHADGFGALYSQQVKVGYGPGRWNRQVSAEALAQGYVGLRRAPSMAGVLEPWHGCMDHNANHCGECRTCDCHES